MKQLIFIFVILLTNGCVTFNSNKTLDPMSITPMENLKCADIEFYTNELNIFNEITTSKVMSDYEASEYKRVLELYNVSTKCSSNISKYKITIGMRNNFMLAKTLWMTTSFITLGILPFYINDHYEIIIEKDSTKEISKSISTNKVISIFLLPLAISNYNYSFKNFKTADSNLAISKEIANYLINDLKETNK